MPVSASARAAAKEAEELRLAIELSKKEAEEEANAYNIDHSDFGNRNSVAIAEGSCFSVRVTFMCGFLVGLKKMAGFPHFFFSYSFQHKH